MAGNPNIRDVSFWRDRLGLLPVPMFIGGGDEQHFVLLNGNRGNFCLSLSERIESDNVRSQCWSSDVGHYIQIKDDFTEVRRWDEPGTTRRFESCP